MYFVRMVNATLNVVIFGLALGPGSHENLAPPCGPNPAVEIKLH